MRKVLVIAVSIWLVISLTAITSGRTGSSVKPGTFPPVHSNSFFDPAHFYVGEFPQEELSGQIRGAVVPHHLLADRLISRVFAELGKQNPSTVILIGPNHENLGGPVVTGFQGWQTPFGVVEVKEETVNQLVQSQLAKKDEQVCGMEHSIGNLMPFIKYYLPNAKVVPVVLHHDLTLEEAGRLGKELAGLVKKDAVLVASVDFSHYLTWEEAEKRDQETLAAMKNRNLGQIFRMGNDYLDSPASLGVLFSAMEEKGIKEFTVLDHTNSGEILHSSLAETTSYFTMLFTGSGED